MRSRQRREMSIRGARLPLLFLFVIAPCCAACAQDDSACLRWTVVVNVTDRKGTVVPDLTMENFRVGGVKGRLVGVERRTQPGRSVVLLDASGSMRGSPQQAQQWWRFSCSLAGNAIASASEEAFGGLLIFADKIREKIEPGQGRRGALDRLNSLSRNPKESARGGTALWDAMGEALQLLRPPQPGDALYVISDGEDNRSQLAVERLEKDLLASGARVFVFMPVTAPSALQGFVVPKRDREGLSGTEQLAVRTGGYTVTWYADDLTTEPKVMGALADAAGKIHQQMSSYYRLEIELLEPLNKPRGWKLEVLDGRGKKRNDVAVLYPRKIMPCAAGGASK